MELAVAPKNTQEEEETNMRQIDNMTPNELDVLRLKNMLPDKTASEASTQSDSQLTDFEWRKIHNALAYYQCQVGSFTDTLSDWAIAERKWIQQLMDKVRDNHIAPTASKASKN